MEKIKIDGHGPISFTMKMLDNNSGDIHDIENFESDAEFRARIPGAQQINKETGGIDDGVA